MTLGIEALEGTTITINVGRAAPKKKTSRLKVRILAPAKQILAPAKKILAPANQILAPC